MLLQPLAENAVRHGIEPLGRTGTLRVTAHMKGETLAVCIEDDGVGMSAASDGPHGFGLGLTNASVRLRAMYGATAGIATMADLLATQPKHMRKLWGNVTGERLWYALHGYDVQTPPSGRGMYGHGRVLPPDHRTASHVKAASRTVARLSLAVHRLAA